MAEHLLYDFSQTIIPTDQVDAEGLAARPHFINHRRGRRLSDGFTLDKHAWVCSTPAAVLDLPGHYAAVLCNSETDTEGLGYPQIWRMMAVARRVH
jgi:hypothetical protein